MATGDHDWTASEVVTAANVDDYLQLQVVGQYTNAAARDAALTTRKREGMLAYLIDLNVYTVYTGAAWSTIGPVHGALTAITPVITQVGVVTYTTNNSTLSRVGRQITWRWTLTVTGTGSAGSVVTLSAPYNINYVSDVASCGEFNIFDASANIAYAASAVPATAGTFKGWLRALSAPTFLGITAFTAALAVGDILSGYAIYEASADA